MIEAVDTYTNNADYGKKAEAKDLYADIQKCGGMLGNMKLAIGTRIMLRKNLQVSKGLVSGSMGVIEGCY